MCPLLEMLKPVRGVIEDLARWARGVGLSGRRCDRDGRMPGNRDRVSGTVIDGRQPGAVIGHPERACWAVGDPPRIDQVGIDHARRDQTIGNQIGLRVCESAHGVPPSCWSSPPIAAKGMPAQNEARQASRPAISWISSVKLSWGAGGQNRFCWVRDGMVCGVLYQWEQRLPSDWDGGALVVRR